MAQQEPLLPNTQQASANPPVTPPNDDSVRRYFPDQKRFNLLINDKPLDNYSPLGAPDPHKQWLVVGMLLMLSVMQGATWGALRAAERILGGYCDFTVADTNLNRSIGAAPSLCTCSAIFQGLSLFVFAPIGGILLDRGRLRNGLLQIAALGVCIAGTMLVLVASASGDGKISLRRIGPIVVDVPIDHAASKINIAMSIDGDSPAHVVVDETFPYVETTLSLTNSSDNTPPPDDDAAAELEGLGWIGMILAVGGLAAMRPLASTLVADQTPSPPLKGTFIAWAFLSFRVGELISVAAADSALEIQGAMILTAACAAACMMLLLLLNAHLVTGESDRLTWGGEPSANISGGSRSDTSEGVGFPFSSILTAMASKPALHVFALALLARAFVQTALAWTKQSTQMDDTLCLGGNLTVSSGEVDVGGDASLVGADCIKVTADVVPVLGTVLGLLLVMTLQSSGVKSVDCIAAAHFSSWPLDRCILGSSLLAATLTLSAILQLAVHAHPHIVPVFWQVPQYTLLSAGEALVLTAGLEYAYTVSAAAMRARATAIFLSFQGLGVMLGLALEAMTATWTLLAQLSLFALCSLLSLTLHHP